MTTPATTSTVVVEPGAQELSFPAVLDSSHASNAAADFFRSYFTAKSKQGGAGTMQHFLPEQTGYADATLGWVFGSYADVQNTFSAAMPNWGDGL